MTLLFFTLIVVPFPSLFTFFYFLNLTFLTFVHVSESPSMYQRLHCCGVKQLWVRFRNEMILVWLIAKPWSVGVERSGRVRLVVLVSLVQQHANCSMKCLTENWVWYSSIPKLPFVVITSGDFRHRELKKREPIFLRFFINATPLIHSLWPLIQSLNVLFWWP